MRTLTLIALAASAAAQPVLFTDIRKRPLPGADADSLQAFVYDLDGDGKLDVVFGSTSDRYTLSIPLVYWNRGGGRFEAGQAIDSVRHTPMGVGDLDRDGDGDVVTSADAFRNDGQGRFERVQTPWQSAYGDRYAVGDVNGDGLADVCTGQQIGRLWINRGGWSFVDATAQVPDELLGHPVFADADGDGDLDLIAFRPGFSAPAVLGRNDGSGRFTVVPPTSFPAPARDVRDVAVADLSGDGQNDVVLVGPQGPALLVNVGGASFADQSGRLNSTAAAHAVAAGDVDGDRDVDLVFGSRVRVNQGGSFTEQPNAWRPIGGPIRDLVLFDGDQDGDLDLFEARAEDLDGSHRYGTLNHVAWNDGRGRFRNANTFPIPLTTPTGGAALGDLDGDGDLDLVAGNVGVLFGDGRGGFGARVGPAAGGRPLLGDLDRDGDLDAVFVERGAAAVLINPGNGLLQATTSVVFGASGTNAFGFDGVLGDFDGDGALDLLVATAGPGQGAYVYGPAPELLYRGDGRGGFAPLPALLPGSTTSFGVAAGDLDGDGDLDAVVDQLVVYWNTGSGFTAAPYPNSQYYGLSRIRLADMDGDGHLDIVCANGCEGMHFRFPYCDHFTDSPRETIVWNDGRGGFTFEQVLATSLSNTRALATGDVDDDGDLDVVFGNIDGPNTPADELVFNAGNRQFRLATQPPLYDQFPFDTGDTRDVLLADVDADGDLDVVGIDDPPGFTDYPASRVFGNLLRHLSAPDLARLGLPYRLWLDGATQGGLLLLAAGPGRASTPFGRFGLDPATTVVAAVFGPPSQGRRVAADPTLPADPSLLDAMLWWQGAVLDRNTLRLTNVVADRIGW